MRQPVGGIVANDAWHREAPAGSPAAGTARTHRVALVRDVGRGTGAGPTFVAVTLGFLGFLGLVIGNGLGLAYALCYWVAWAIYAGLNRSLAPRVFSTLLPWIFPAWAMLSMLWSRDPASTVRVSLMLMISTAITILVAHALTARGIMLTLFLALFVGSGIGLLTGGSEVIYTGNVEALHGIFGSKNNFAMLAAMLILTGFGIALDRGFGRPARLVGAAGVGLGFYELYQAHSAGSNIAVLFAIALFLALQALRSLPVQMRTLVLIVLGAITLLAGAMATVLLDGSSIDRLLQLLGKNPTLTGRAYLWARAQESIDAHRWLGIGFQAWWRQGYLDAEGLWRYLMVEARAGVSMHNLYYETAIEVGLIGFSLLMVQLVLTFASSLAAAIYRPDTLATVGTGICAFFFTRLFLETDFLAPFGIGTVMFVLIWTHCSRNLIDWRRQPVHPRPGASPRGAVLAPQPAELPR